MEPHSRQQLDDFWLSCRYSRFDGVLPLCRHLKTERNRTQSDLVPVLDRYRQSDTLAVDERAVVRFQVLEQYLVFRTDELAVRPRDIGEWQPTVAVSLAADDERKVFEVKLLRGARRTQNTQPKYHESLSSGNRLTRR